MTKVIYRMETYGEGDWHVALCPELGISRSGKTPREAKADVQEAVESYSPRVFVTSGILSGGLEDSGSDEKSDDMWRLKLGGRLRRRCQQSKPGVRRSPATAGRVRAATHRRRS